jgi:hypothetical protein
VPTCASTRAHAASRRPTVMRAAMTRAALARDAMAGCGQRAAIAARPRHLPPRDITSSTPTPPATWHTMTSFTSLVTWQGASELAPGTRIYTGGVEAIVDAVLAGTHAPLECAPPRATLSRLQRRSAPCTAVPRGRAARTRMRQLNSVAPPPPSLTTRLGLASRCLTASDGLWAGAPTSRSPTARGVPSPRSCENRYCGTCGWLPGIPHQRCPVWHVFGHA